MTKDYPQLKFVHGVAETREWFGNGAKIVMHEKLVDGKMWYYFRTIATDGGAVVCDFCGSEQEVIQRAQEYFKRELARPMDFKAVLNAWARGLETVNPAGNRYKYDVMGRLIQYTRAYGRWESARFYKSMARQTQTLYFPDKPEPERIEAYITRAFQCPKCDTLHHMPMTDDSKPLDACKGCGIALHRPETKGVGDAKNL